jgi:DNA-binding transcriptional ArsR family regulator
VAEAFTRAWMSWRKVRDHPAPRAWVVRTALISAIRALPARQREVIVRRVLLGLVSRLTIIDLVNTNQRLIGIDIMGWPRYPGGMDGVISEAHLAPEDFRLTAILAALADPARLAAVRTLAAKGESPCTRLQHDAGLTISRTTFSHHQKVLREAGIILARVRGTERILSLRKDDLDQRYPGLLGAILNAPDDRPE